MTTGVTRISQGEVQLAEANSVPVAQVTTVTVTDRLAKTEDTKLKQRGGKCGFSFQAKLVIT